MEIIMPRSVNDIQIGEAFNQLFKIILAMEQSDDEEFVWNFNRTSFLTPFFILPLMLYRDKCGKNITCINISDSMGIYFDAINFESGTIAEEIEDFHMYMKKFSNKRYIPIINFPACATKDSIKNDIISAAESILAENLNLNGQIRNAISYMLSEIIDNITEHSHCERGYIFAQYYPSKKYIDICIADNGISILGSYIKAGRKDITTDVEALQCAGTGVSTKNLPNAENRGYGIMTCKNMLAKGLKGIYFLLSGQAFHAMNNENTSYIGLPNNIKWDGTIVALRIPYSENKEFNYLKYLE